MNTLKDKTTKSYNYISRYATFPFYYNKNDDKYVYGLTSNLITEGVEYVVHVVKIGETLEYLSNYYYGRPDYYWIIADFNRIQDSLINLSSHYQKLKIPSITSLKFKN